MRRVADHPGLPIEPASEPSQHLPPDFEQHIYSPQKIAACVAELEGQGVTAEAALEGTGLTETQLYAATARVSYRQVDRVLRNALQLTKDSALGLHAGRRMHVTAFGIYGYALLSSATYAEALDFATQHHQVIGPLCDTLFLHDADEVTYVFEPLFWSDPAEDIYRLCVEFAMSTHLTVGRDFHGPSFRFSSIDMVCSAPPAAHASAQQTLFECPVRFEQPRNEVHFDRNWINRPAVLADRTTHAVTRELCEQLSSEVNRGDGIAADIRRILIEQQGQFPSIEALAERLGLHPRALRRRLEAKGTSYRDLLAEVRMRLATEYLLKTHMTNDEIASRLAYSDAANFRRAFTRWTGKNPSDFRVV